jgi:hypothetical protein
LRARILLIALLALSASAAPPPGFADKMASAIFLAEGGKKAKVPYGILSVKVKDEADARRICLNSINNSWARWEKSGSPGDFITFFGARWAPVGASNDPRNLNSNWVRNVRAIMKGTK